MYYIISKVFKPEVKTTSSIFNWSTYNFCNILIVSMARVVCFTVDKDAINQHYSTWQAIFAFFCTVARQKICHRNIKIPSVNRHKASNWFYKMLFFIIYSTLDLSLCELSLKQEWLFCKVSNYEALRNNFKHRQ